MLTPLQQHCLTGMGIAQWRLRPPDIEPSEEPVVEIKQTVAAADLAATVKDQIPTPKSQPDTSSLAVVEDINYPVDDWPQLLESIQSCKNCALAQSCTRKVPGKGFDQADLMIIGEAPGHDEDLQGKPFVGRAGQLLNKMLAAIKLDLNSLYITNILKCRPPNNRDPHSDEVKACSQFLRAQIKLVQPKIILSVGRISAQNLLQQQSPLGRLRTSQHILPETEIPLLVTYHPAYLLRNPAEKVKVWEDLKNLHRLLQHAPD